MDEIQLLRTLVNAFVTDPNRADNIDRAGAGALKKALTASNGFIGINLEPAAKMMLPVFAGLRHRLRADTPQMGGASAQWRMQLGFGSFAFGSSANFGTTSNGNGGATTESAVTIAATYAPMSINGGVDWQAIKQAAGWDNAMAIDTKMALSLLLRLEEYECLFGNTAAVVMTTVTMTASTTHAGPTFANGTWNIRVTALSGQGTLTNATTNSNTGESDVASASVASGASGCDFFDVTWPYVPGALGYKVYIERTAGGGTYYLCRPGTELAYAKADTSGNYNTTGGDTIVNTTGQTFVTVNRVQIKAIPPNTQPTSTTGDNSANSNVFEGMAAWCTKNTIYGQSLTGSVSRNVIDQAGLPLTTISTGILEFDNYLNTQWLRNHTSPSLVLCSPKSIVSAGNKIAAASNAQIRLDVYQNRNAIVGGLYIGGYVNKFASGMAGMQTTIDMWAHPYMPDGTFLFLSEDVPPETLPYSGEGKTFALDVQTPYTYWELGKTNRSIPYDIFYEETLKCYWPDAQGAIVGVRVDS